MATTHLPATDLYKQRYAEIEKLIALLERKLKEHKVRAMADRYNYGYAGDLEYVEERLREATEFCRS